MTKKRASLAGRGVEILFGGEPANSSNAESPSVEKATSPADASASLEQPAGAMESDLAAMLEAEAASATAGTEPSGGLDIVVPAEVESTSDLGVVIPPEPAKEAMPILDFTAEDGRPDWPAAIIEDLVPASEATVAEEGVPLLVTAPAQPAEDDLPLLATTPIGSAESMPAMEFPAVSELPVAGPVSEVETMTYTPTATPSGPTYEAETPPSPMYTEPHAEPEEPSAPLPPPRDKPEAYDPVVRTKIEGALYSTVTEKPPEERLLPDGPSSAALELRAATEYKVGQPSRTRDEREVMDYVGLKQRQALWNDITDLYKQVPDVLCNDELQDEALQLLQESQDILMEKPRQFDISQYKVGQVRSIVTRRKNTVRWTNTWGWATLFYEVLWIIALGAAIIFAPLVVAWVESIVGASTAWISVPDLWNTSAWGSIGGVLGALYSLYWHAAQAKDFDKQYIMWYFVQPVIGIIIGALVYVIFGGGFMTGIGVRASGDQTAIPLFKYAVACIAGFRQRFILEVVDRIIQLLTSGFEEKDQPAEQLPPPVEG